MMSWSRPIRAQLRRSKEFIVLNGKYHVSYVVSLFTPGRVQGEMGGEAHNGNSVVLDGPPDCSLQELKRQTTRHGCTLVTYAGADGDTYEALVGPIRTIWMRTRQPDGFSPP
jgi:hypothetical protein